MKVFTKIITIISSLFNNIKNDKRNKQIFFIVYFVYLLILILSAKFLGLPRGIANLYPSTKLSWGEILDILPRYVIGTTIFTILFMYIYIEAVKIDKKRIEDAKKRIEEKRKKKKGKSSEISNVNE